MSRSRKKSPVYTDGSAGTTKESKKFANKKVRHTEDLPNKGTSYKKVYPQYDIHDYINRWTWEEAKRDYESGLYPWLNERYPTLKDFYRYWFKITIGK